MRALVATCGLLMCSLVFGSARAQDFQLEASVLSSTGGTSGVGAFSLTSTVGQPSPVGRAAGASFVLFSGYPSPFFGRVGVRIVHTPPAEAQPRGDDVTLTARIETEKAPVERVVLRYRSGGEPSFADTPMQRMEDDIFQATLPGTAVGETGVAYQIVVTDRAGNQVRAPAPGVFSFPVHIEAPGLVSDHPLPAGATQAAYRLISVPIRLDDPAPSAVLGDDVPSLESAAAYDERSARFFDPRGETASEFPRTRDMTPGRAFWLIVKAGVSDLDTGTGAIPALSGPRETELEAGWNFVGNPFNFPIPVENLRLAAGDPVVLRTYTGSYNTVSNPVTEMQPFTGYALFVEEDGTLFIDPAVTASSAQARPKAQLAGAKDRLRWWIRITGRAGAAHDADNVVAVAPGASAEQGELDWHDPPTPFSMLSVHFSHPEWGGPMDRYSSDVRPELSEGTVWPVKVISEEDVTLSFEGLAGVPSSFQVWLVDPVLKVTQDLRQAARYRLPASGEAGRMLQLVIGTPDFVQARFGEMKVLPEAYDLSEAFPNPSGGDVTLGFGLPEAVRVTARVYTVLGQHVRTLLDGEQLSAGHHPLRWDGRDGRGVPVASGLYFVRVRAGDFRATRKVVIVR